MEKMNQVSVTEFFSKSKEEMYDMAVEMVEKYNRLADICNDSAERMAELMAKDDINEFKKELQSKEIGEFKIQKLADIVVWFDDWIEEAKLDLTEEDMEDDTTIKEFETIKKVILESMERQTVYSNALNKDIADKAAKIELLEKEIEGRKEGYYALKRKVDVDLVNKDKEIANLKKELDARGKEIAELRVKIRHQKENLDGINKTLEIRTKENEHLIAVRNNKEKEIEAHESENARLSERIMELKKQVKNFESETIELSRIITKYKKENGDYAVRVGNLKKELEQTCTTKELDLKGHQRREMSLVNALADKNDEIKKLKESIEEWKNQERIRTNQLRATERKVEELWKEIEKFTKGEEDDNGKSGFKRYIEHLIEEEERAVPERFKERLNEEITKIFKKEEETEVNDIPCGEDAIE